MLKNVLSKPHKLFMRLRLHKRLPWLGSPSWVTRSISATSQTSSTGKIWLHTSQEPSQGNIRYIRWYFRHTSQSQMWDSKQEEATDRACKYPTLFREGNCQQECHFECDIFLRAKDYWFEGSQWQPFQNHDVVLCWVNMLCPLWLAIFLIVE